MKEKEQAVAEKEVFSLSPTGDKRVVRIAIGKPYQIDAVSWGCPVALDGLYKDLRDAVGGDSWQALSLAISLVHQLLTYHLRDGAKLFWEEGGEEVLLNDLFPQFKGF